MKNNGVSEANSQKQLGIVHDNRLSTVYKIIPRSALITVYKVFVRPHVNYSNIYGQAYNANFHQKLELIQNNSTLALIRAIRGTSKEKFYEELGLKYLQRRCLNRKSYFHKFYKNELSKYLFKSIPVRSS